MNDIYLFGNSVFKRVNGVKLFPISKNIYKFTVKLIGMNLKHQKLLFSRHIRVNDEIFRIRDVSVILFSIAGTPSRNTRRYRILRDE